MYSNPKQQYGSLFSLLLVCLIGIAAQSFAGISHSQLSQLEEWLPYQNPEFELLFAYYPYEASDEDVSSVDLHRAIDKAGPTITILNVQAPYDRQARTIGGYNPHNWKSWFGKYEKEAGRFVFDLTRGLKWERQTNIGPAVRRSTSEYGLAFGLSDIVVDPNLTTGTATNHSFASNDGSSVLLGQSGPFKVNSIEVYRVRRSSQPEAFKAPSPWVDNGYRANAPPPSVVPDGGNPLFILVLLSAVIVGMAKLSRRIR